MRKSPVSEVDEIILGASSGSDALISLLRWRRTNNPKWSLIWISNQLKVPSKSQIGDILTGRRKMSPKLWGPMLKLLELNGLALQYCKLLLKIEKLLREAEEIEAEDYEKLAALRKALISRTWSPSHRFASDQMVLLVNASFGLFGGRATRSDLVGVFGKSKFMEVDYALHVLLNEKIIDKVGVEFVQNENAEFVTFFAGRDSNQAMYEILKNGLEQSKKSIDVWAPNKDLACFRSALLCVNRDKYIQKLNEFKEDLMRLHADMAEKSGDMVIRMDFQIYPIMGNEIPQV